MQVQIQLEHVFLMPTDNYYYLLAGRRKGSSLDSAFYFECM